MVLEKEHRTRALVGDDDTDVGVSYVPSICTLHDLEQASSEQAIQPSCPPPRVQVRKLRIHLMEQLAHLALRVQSQVTSYPGDLPIPDDLLLHMTFQFQVTFCTR